MRKLKLILICFSLMGIFYPLNSFSNNLNSPYLKAEYAAVKPTDVLKDGEDTKDFSGMTVRKGTISAFIQNIEIIEDPKSNQNAKNQAMDVMKELAPALIALGVYQHVTFKNKKAQAILDNAYKHQNILPK